MATKFLLRKDRSTRSISIISMVYFEIPNIWAMVYYSKHKQDKMANVLNTKSLFVHGVIKQIMFVFIRAMVKIFSLGERWNFLFHSAVAS